MTAVGTTAATGLAGVLANLNSNQLLNLGHHLTASDEAKALALVGSMTTPALAMALSGPLGAIPNVPPQVMTWVTLAMSTTDPGAFGTDRANAMAALQAAVTAPGLLGSLGL